MNRSSGEISLARIAPMLLLLLGPLAARAQDLPFRVHVLNANSEFCACAAFDVNRDGKLDVFCGGFWYEAPTWKRHFVREVEIIRGRHDDFSNLPIDVDGDGWTDVVSANYRSQTIYWVKNPGTSDGTWTVQQIDKPGPMETARLFDIDGDGRSDILPNGVQFAAWWELKAGGDQATFVRHDLPKEVAGHGGGFGDVNADGRGDLVGPSGWLEAPADRRKDRWIWHADFTLHRDCGLPILVLDVDGDKDNDIVYGRGHNVGLYWLEHHTDRHGENRARETWERHAIDTSVSQYHSLLTGDLDGDGRLEIVAGRRFMGHEGRDIGEYDPLVVAAYTWLPESRTFLRRTIHVGKVGFGLDPKIADLDADGDLDLICPGRSGLYLLENLQDKNEFHSGPAKHPGTYTDHSRLLVYQDDAGQEHPVKTPLDWGIRRRHILEHAERAMGDLPTTDLRVPLDVKVELEEDTPDYVRQKITFAAMSPKVAVGNRVPAYLLIPKNLQGRAPAMLCLHQTTAIGKGEPAGLGGLKNLHYAHELASRGYVCIVPDYPSFGDYAIDFKAQPTPFASGTMRAIWNNMRAVDVLDTLPEVDPDRIGCIGHSLGGHNTVFTAVFDQRIKAMVSSCGFNAFRHYYAGNLAGWTSDRYMPRIRDLYGNSPDKVPFDFYELVAALAPRAFYINAPLRDSNFEVEGVRKVVAEAGKVYALYGAADKLKAAYPDAQHDFPEEQRREAYEFLDRQLKP